ncbi:MAG: 50S ribosomal protein L35ae [Nanoarchaeota archaeon]|nr:50S ribosomal protein L35ae [Nanoarchaeota archaeon]
MEGIIVNYRRGRKTQTTNQMIVIIPDVDKEKAAKLVGKTATYTCEGKNKKQIKGTISAVHGNKGAVRILFETGMPGQAIGGKITIN